MNSAWHGNEDIMAEKVDYGTLKEGRIHETEAEE